MDQFRNLDSESRTRLIFSDGAFPSEGTVQEQDIYFTRVHPWTSLLLLLSEDMAAA